MPLSPSQPEVTFPRVEDRPVSTASILQLLARERNFSRKDRWSENHQLLDELMVEK